MRRFVTYFVALAIFALAQPTVGSAEIVLVDFGSIVDDGVSANNITVINQSLSNAVDTMGGTTSISFTAAGGTTLAGPNTAGTNTPGGSAAGLYTSDMAKDSLFGHNASWSGGGGVDRSCVEYSITGLDSSLTYNFSFFASRITSLFEIPTNRETEYTLTGQSATSTILEVADNTDNVAELFSVAPTATGEISLKMEAGPNSNPDGFFYIGAIQVEAVPEPGSFLMFSLLLAPAMVRRRTLAS